MGGQADAQWFLTTEEFDDMPAFKGTTWDEELENRYQAASFLQKMGMKINLYRSL